jgi:anti-anti-sigma factor
MSTDPRIDVKLIESSEKVTHVALCGRLDTEGVGAVELAFASHTAARRRPTIVDLSGVDYLASLGMGMLVRTARSLSSHSAGMVLLNPQGPVERALRAAQIDSVVPIVYERDEALRRLQL